MQALSIKVSSLALTRTRSKDPEQCGISPSSPPSILIHSSSVPTSRHPSSEGVLYGTTPTEISATDRSWGPTAKQEIDAIQIARPPRIRFAPLPDPRRPRAYSTGRNVWLEASDDDGEQQHPPLASNSDITNGSGGGNWIDMLSRAMSSPSATSHSMSKSAPTTPTSPLSRTSWRTKKLFAPLGIVRTSTMSSEDSSKSSNGSWTPSPLDYDEPSRSAYPPVAQSLNGGIMSPPMLQPLDAEEVQFEEWDFGGDESALLDDDDEDEDEEEEDEGNSLEWVGTRRISKHRKMGELIPTASVSAPERHVDQTCSDMEVEAESEAEEPDSHDDDLSPEELALEEQLAEEACRAELSKGSLGQEKWHNAAHIGSMRRSSSGTPATLTPVTPLALSPCTTRSM